MPVIHPFNPGDLVIRINEYVDPNHPWEKTGLEALQRYHKYKDDPYYEDEPVIEFNLWKIDRVKKGRIYALHPATNVVDEDVEYFSYDSKEILKYDSDKFNEWFKNNPPKFKVGDKIINPYLQLSDQTINEHEEYKVYDDLWPSLNVMLPDNSKRAFYCKSIPYLLINNIFIKVKYNKKYNKFLSSIEYLYWCTSDRNVFQDLFINWNTPEKHIQAYSSYTTIWNNACTSQSPAT